MLTETSMMETSRMTSVMDSVYTSTKMRQNMKETGNGTRSTVMALRLILLAIVTRVNTIRARKMDRVNIHGKMATPTRENSTSIKWRAKVLIMTNKSLFDRDLSVD